MWLWSRNRRPRPRRRAWRRRISRAPATTGAGPGKHAVSCRCRGQRHAASGSGSGRRRRPDRPATGWLPDRHRCGRGRDGWPRARMARRRRGVRRRARQHAQQQRVAGQRFGTGDGLRIERQHIPGQDGVVEHRLRKFDSPAGRNSRAASAATEDQVEHLPGAAGVAQRRAVMDFTGIDGDDLPGLGLHLAASAVRACAPWRITPMPNCSCEWRAKVQSLRAATACTPARALRCMRNWLAGMERAAGRQGTQGLQYRAARGRTASARANRAGRRQRRRPDGPQRRPCV